MFNTQLTGTVISRRLKERKAPRHMKSEGEELVISVNTQLTGTVISRRLKESKAPRHMKSEGEELEISV